MAYADRPWVLDGADVRVSFVAFSETNSKEQPLLDGAAVSEIFENLTSGLEISSALRLPENDGIAFRGMEKNGSFELSPLTAAKMLSSPLNPNGRPNADVVRPWINAYDVLQRPRNLYVIDFGVNRTSEEAALYEAPFTYAEAHVKPQRVANRRARRAERWWLFGETAPGLRTALENSPRYIVTGRVSKHRLFAWTAKNTIADSRLSVFARSDDFFFGLLHSRVHERWALAQASRHGIGNDPTYNNESCFDTFPFPWPPGTEPAEDADPRVKAIADAARDLVSKRDAWLNPPGISEAELKTRTLTNLYNKHPEWLANAHRTLDTAVFAAYGWPADLPDQEILARLLALNHERAAAQNGDKAS